MRVVVCATVAALVLWLVLGLSGATLAGSGAVGSLSARALSIFEPEQTLDTDSLAFRLYETGEATRSIAQHPWLGVGLGNVYRDVTLLTDEASANRTGRRLTWYIHDGFLFMTVKMGLPAMLVFAWFSLAFIVGGLRAYIRSPYGRSKILILASLASYVGFLEWSLTSPLTMDSASACVVGMMLGLVAAVRPRAVERGLIDAAAAP
jgi:O-antigen ligase